MVNKLDALSVADRWFDIGDGWLVVDKLDRKAGKLAR